MTHALFANAENLEQKSNLWIGNLFYLVINMCDWLNDSSFCVYLKDDKNIHNFWK